jgi:putative membrane protein
MHKLVGLVAVLLIGLAVLAQDQGEMQPDVLFATTAAQGDIYEIASSQLALERAESQEVRDFAQRMIDEHSQTTEQLSAIAQELGMTLPTEASAMHEFMLAHLASLQGAEFETAYLQQQVIVHQAAVNAFEAAAAGAVQNEELQAFASENLQAIQEHLQMAQQLAGQAAQQ